MKRWAKGEDAFILKTPHLTTEQVAAKLGRSVSAVRSRRSLLGKAHALTFRQNNDPFKVGRRRLLARTCTKCGLLLEASRFGMEPRGGWRAACVHCRGFEGAAKRPDRNRGLDSAALANRRLQELSLPYAVNHRKPWTERDDEVLANPDLMVIEKAITLGRTYMATASACSDRGFTSRVGQGDPVRGQWVIDNPNAAELVAA